MRHYCGDENFSSSMRFHKLGRFSEDSRFAFRVALCLSASPRIRSTHFHFLRKTKTERSLFECFSLTLLTGKRFRRGFCRSEGCIEAFWTSSRCEKNRQERYDIGESSLKSTLVRTGRIQISFAQSVDQGVRSLVNDNIMGKASI